MKNRYIKTLVFLVLIVMVLSFVSAIPTNNKAKEPLDKITFIHYKDGIVKEVGRAISGGDKCYKLLGVKWSSLPVNYVINPGSYNTTFVANAISTSIETWDTATSRELFNNVYSIDFSATLDTSSPDFKNEYVFGAYSDANVIAITNIWYTRYGRRIIDYDVLFNIYYTWGDATINPSLMDLQNIATHETGHGLGLADLYTSTCSAVTMYGYSANGETNKRTLEQSDISGLQKMYGI